MTPNHQLFNALAAPQRCEIFRLLSQCKEVCAGDISKHLESKQPAISYHLNIMQKAGLIQSRPDGKKVYYSLNQDTVAEMAMALATGLSAQHQMQVAEHLMNDSGVLQDLVA